MNQGTVSVKNPPLTPVFDEPLGFLVSATLLLRNILKILESQLDAEDKYIMSIINKQSKKFLILLGAKYYTYTSGEVMIIGGRYRWYQGWYLTNTKKPY